MKAPDPIDHRAALGRPALDPVALADEGYVQEANRRFFHPLGLHMALEVSRDPEDPLLVRLMDCREAIAGVVYAPAEDFPEAIRRHRTGIVRQPVNAPFVG